MNLNNRFFSGTLNLLLEFQISPIWVFISIVKCLVIFIIYFRSSPGFMGYPIQIYIQFHIIPELCKEMTLLPWVNTINPLRENHLL